MSHKLLIGLEFDGEYDPRVRAELEQLVAGLQTWQVNTSPNDAEYVVGSASTDLTNERVATSSPTIRVDRGSAGLIQWHANQAAFGAGYMMGIGGGEEGSDGPPGRDGTIGVNGAQGPQGVPGTGIIPCFDGDDGMDCWMPGPQGNTGATGATALLAVTNYNPSSLTDVSITSTTGVDVDATNLTITFTVPTSGNVVIGLCATCFSSTSSVGLMWLLRTTGGSNVAGTKRQVTPASTTTGQQIPVYHRIYLSGLSAGTSQTYRWGAMLTGAGTGHIRYGDDTNATGQEYGPAVMEVWSAP